MRDVYEYLFLGEVAYVDFIWWFIHQVIVLLWHITIQQLAAIVAATLLIKKQRWYIPIVPQDQISHTKG